MSISFSGLASGMDTSSWVEALVSVKQAEITKLETKRTTVAAAQETLNSIKSFFTSFQSLLENITDARFGIASIDLFSQNLAESSNISVLSAIASTSAENTTYNIEVNKLATATEVVSGIKNTVTKEETPIATLDTKLTSLITADGSEILTNSGEEGDRNGIIQFYVDNDIREVTIKADSTIGSFIDDLDRIGISASYNESNGVFSINIDSRTDNESATRVANDYSNVIKALNLSDVNQGYKTNYIEVVNKANATLGSTLAEIGITDIADLQFEIYKEDGTTITSSFTSAETTTLETVFARLYDDYGITGSIDENGVITLTSGTHGNVFGGNLAEAMHIEEVESPFVSLTKVTSTDIVLSTQETLVNRDSTLGQIGAFKNEGDKLIIKNCDGGSTVETIETLTADSTVQDLFNVLAEHGITANIVDGVITLNSTSGKYIDGAIATNIGINAPVVDTHFTTAPVTMTSSGDINTASTLGGLGMSSDASVVIYSPVYGVVSVNIAKELTVSQFCDRINDSNYGIHAEISGNGVRLTELAGSGSYVKGMSSVLQSALKLVVGESEGSFSGSYNSTTINVYANTDSGYIKYNDETVAISSNTTISQIAGYSHGTGEILLHQGDNVSTIMVDSTLTLEEFINNPIVGLAQYGITGHILSDGKAYLSADSDIYLEKTEGNTGSNILSALKFSGVVKTYSGDHVSSTGGDSATVVSVTTEAAKGSDKINSTVTINGTTVTINATGSNDTATMVFTVNDYYKTVTLDKDDTYNSFIDKLNDAGINAYMAGGKFYIASGYDDVQYISGQSTANTSFAEIIGLTGPTDLGGYSISNEAVRTKVVSSHEETLSASNYAGFNTKLSTVGISEGLLTVYKNGQRATIDINSDDTFGLLQSNLSYVFNDLYIDFDENNFLRDGKLKICSRDENANISIGSTSDRTNFVAITGIAKNDENQLESSRQLYKINDKTALSEENLFRAFAKRDTLLSTVGITSGDFTITNNGESHVITISSNETFDSLQAKINDSFSDLSISFDNKNSLTDGTLKIFSTNENANISVTASGANASNITTVCNFSSDSETSSATSKQLYQKVLTGSFKVGDADIYITDTTTISDIVSQINASEKSLATAYWDNIDGKLVIKSTVTGASAVNISQADDEANRTNFTDLLGVTSGNNLVMDTQTIGSNAVLTINGTKYTSLSNNVTSDATGITGLTINLKGLSNGSVVTLNVKRDTESLVNAVSNVLERYNELISSIDAAIAKDGKLKDQSMLKLIRNNIRTAMNSADPGSTRFRNLASIGIKASDSSASNISTDNSDITFLSLDTETFMNAFENYEEDVKALLIGSVDSKGNVINEGILTKVEKIIEGALTAANGYFVTANNAYSSQIDSISQKIVNGTAAIEKYRKRLENKFSAMDMMIANMQNQFSSFLS